MEEGKRYPEHLVFGLDIGTRSVVGTVGYLDRKIFKVVAQSVREHDTRAMLDGQIHDIEKVGQVIYEVKTDLERIIGRELKEVCIAAAGRVLRTVTTKACEEFPEETHITPEHVYSLDMLGVEQAHQSLSQNETKIQFYCVGYTVIQYYLNDFEMNVLEGHKGYKIEADVLATFLPEEVVDSLNSAVSEAGLEVVNLTLEPIAAIQLAIPEQFRLLNIALVDIGAGTSDICITKDGSIIAYGMIPVAGDELTEILAKEYLLDFASAEQLKMDIQTNEILTYQDVMGLTYEIDRANVLSVLAPALHDMSKSIADRIRELNGGKSVSAVFLVGGGGKILGFPKMLAHDLEIIEERVALRGAEVMKNIEFLNQEIEKDSLLVTPIGICLNFYNQKNSFIFVYFNNERIKLYDNDKLTVIDAAIQADYPNEDLFPKRGQDLSFFVNGKERIIRGLPGEGAIIRIDRNEVNLQTAIHQNDRIFVTPSTAGESAHTTIEKLPEYEGNIRFEVNGKPITCPKFPEVNGTLESGYYEIQQKDHIQFLNYYTVEQAMQFLDIPMDSVKIFVNNALAFPDTKIYENFSVTFRELTGTYQDLVDEYGEEPV